MSIIAFFNRYLNASFKKHKTGEFYAYPHKNRYQFLSARQQGSI